MGLRFDAMDSQLLCAKPAQRRKRGRVIGEEWNMVAGLVSVIVPCFNARATLSRTLASVLCQTYRSLEVLVVDDGSTDLTLSIAAEFAARDDRVRIITQSNRGVAAARNRGIAEARGTYIAPIDADDLWRPDKLELQVAAFAANPAVGVVYTWFDHINERDEIVRGGFRPRDRGQVLERLARFDFVGNGSNAMMRADLVRAVGGYDETLRLRGAEGCEDWRLSLAMAERTQFEVVERPLTGYRLSRAAMSGDIRRMLDSARLVADFYSERYPRLAPVFRRHLTDRLGWNVMRALSEGRFRDAAAVLSEARNIDAATGMMNIARLPAFAARSSASAVLDALRRRAPGLRRRRTFLAS